MLTRETVAALFALATELDADSNLEISEIGANLREILQCDVCAICHGNDCSCPCVML